MNCTFANCEQAPTREVTWIGVRIKLGPFTHDYCELHTAWLREHQQVIHERVLEVAR